MKEMTITEMTNSSKRKMVEQTLGQSPLGVMAKLELIVHKAKEGGDFEEARIHVLWARLHFAGGKELVERDGQERREGLATLRWAGEELAKGCGDGFLEERVPLECINGEVVEVPIVERSFSSPSSSGSAAAAAAAVSVFSPPSARVTVLWTTLLFATIFVFLPRVSDSRITFSPTLEMCTWKLLAIVAVPGPVPRRVINGYIRPRSALRLSRSRGRKAGSVLAVMVVTCLRRTSFSNTDLIQAPVRACMELLIRVFSTAKACSH